MVDNTSQLFGPTDFILRNCKIIGADGKPIEFKLISAELSYFEDLFGNASSGQLSVSDSDNRLSDKSFCGDEFLKLELEKPGNDDPGNTPLKKYCRIYNVSGRNLTKDTNENYVFNFSTEEIFLSEQYRVSKSYKKKRIDEIVVDIAKTYLKIREQELKQENIFETLGTFDIIIPNLKPLEAINWLCTHAVSIDTRLKGATFLFFNNKEGWNFKPIIGIYGDYEKYGLNGGYIYDRYWYGVKNDGQTEIDDPSGWDIKNIISYQIMNNYDSFESTQDGIFANRLIWTDNKSRLHEETIFDYDKYFNEIKGSLSLYKNWHPYGLMSDAENRFKQKHNEVHETVLKQGFKTENNRINETIPYRYAQLRLATATRLKVAVPGDTNLTVGMVVYIDLRAPAPVQASNAESSKKLDKFYCGRYLITALRHRIDQEQNFETTLELCKDSFVSAVSTMDTPGLLPYNNGSEELIRARTQGTF